MNRSARRRRPASGRRGAVAPGHLRIIGGRWRGRRLPVADLPGLRPTGDRVRETLFNWLAPELAGARCLDMFAGTGALGLEALSRGAAACDFLETQHPALEALRGAVAVLGAGDRATVHAADALAFEAAAASYDIVFLDPPFDDALTETALRHLRETRVLAPDALVYLEYPVDRKPAPGEAFEALREQRAGTVAYALLRHAPQGEAA